MAIAFDNGTNNNGVGSTLTTSLTVSSAANRILFVFVRANAKGNVSGVTYNGVAMTRYMDYPVGTSFGGGNPSLFYLFAPTSGANNIVVSVTSSTTIRMCAASYTGVNQSTWPSNAGAVDEENSALVATSTLTPLTTASWGIAVYAVNGTKVAQSGTDRANNGPDAVAIQDTNGTISLATAMTVTESGLNQIAIQAFSLDVPGAAVNSQFLQFF